VDGSANASDGSGGDPEREHREMKESISGVAAPDCTGDKGGGARRSASDAARSRRLVVPSALVEPERAEQMMASLCRSK
jgi:hypothetical protein